MSLQPEFTLLYDGACPICQKEVAWLQWKNQTGKLGFQDINAAGFEPSRYGKTLPELMAEIHGVYPNGQIIKGMAVFRACYRAVGLGWATCPHRLASAAPLIRCPILIICPPPNYIGRFFAWQGLQGQLMQKQINPIA